MAGRPAFFTDLRPTCCATALLPTCWKAGPTCEVCRLCWAIPISRPPRFIPTSCGRDFGKRLRNTTPGRKRSLPGPPARGKESRAYAMSDYIYMLESHLSPDQNRVVEEVQVAAAQVNVNLFLTG